MEAKDTLMNIKQAFEAVKEWENLPESNDINLDDYLTQRQAEISFKAGEEKGYSKCLDDNYAALKDRGF